MSTEIGSDKTKNSTLNICYFCNEQFTAGLFQDHLKQCGSFLEQCPRKCGAWLQRRQRDSHAEKCPKGKGSTSPTHAKAMEPFPSPIASSEGCDSKASLEERLVSLENDITDIKFVLTEESYNREAEVNNLETMRCKLGAVEEKTQHFVMSLGSLRLSLDEVSARKADVSEDFKHDIVNIQSSVQDMQSQQLATDMRLDSLASQLARERDERELVEQALSHYDQRMRNIHKLEMVKYLKETVEKDKEEIAVKYMDDATLPVSSHHLGDLITGSSQLQASESPVLNRLAVLEVATVNVREETAEVTARLDTLTRDLRALTKSYLKLRNELADFQCRVSFDQGLGSDDGHFIWRVDKFNDRMKAAKESDAIVCSPLFRTSKYGYTLKAELRLNGVGKWKGQYLACGIRVAAGPYDNLLQWPCDIVLNITLKDQAKDIKQAMDITKCLQVRRKHPSYQNNDDKAVSKSSTPRSTMERTEVNQVTEERAMDAVDKSLLLIKRQNVFIPHASLYKLDYVRQDVMFLEFNVK